MQVSNSVNFHHLNKIHPLQKVNQGHHPNKTSSTAFKDIYQQEIRDIKISKHAQKRMDERNIHLSKDQLITLNTKLDEAFKKGVKDSLVLLEDSALVVNAGSKTVITALAKDEAESQIFTNINGAILMH
jgi:flagellar operon protein